MHASSGRSVRALLLGTALAIAVAGTALAESPRPSAPASDPPGPSSGATLTVEPPVVAVTVAPGEAATTTLTLRAGRALDLTIEPMGLGQAAEDGSFRFLAPAEDTTPYTARPFLAVDPSTLSLAAGEARRVTVTIDLPEGPADGERYALLKVSGVPSDGDGNVGIGVALGVSVLVTLAGTTAEPAASLEDLAVAEVVPGLPVTLGGAIANTGAVHFGAPPARVYQAAILRTAAGDALAAARGTIEGNSTIPTFKRAFELALEPAEPLAPGAYTIEVEAGLEGGAVLDTATLEFSVAARPATAGPSDELLPYLLAALLGALIAIMALFLVGRSRRSPGGAEAP